MNGDRSWNSWAISRIEADYRRSADTHLFHVALPSQPQISIYLKDESSHPTGSLKHRLARSLFLYGICNGWINQDTPIIEASSGSTAVSEAYFARMLGLEFISVVPRSTSEAKIAAIEFYGGSCHFVDGPWQMREEAGRLAQARSGHFVDQFTYAERATDWRGNNNIAESIFTQMSREPSPVPSWLVCGAGTGGTSATLGRFIRYNRHDTQLCVADPVQSVFHQYWNDRTVTRSEGSPSLIEGIGRPVVEPSFVPEVVDRMEAICDSRSVAAARVISRRMGRLCGGSTGTNIWASAILATEMAAEGRRGSIVTILCDGGERYRDSYFDEAWVRKVLPDAFGYEARLEQFFETGRLDNADL
jgi:cysteine synthase A